jgi:hypothetical protein
MGQEIYLTTGIGFEFSVKEFESQFAKLRTEKYHFENRWDPKTGEQIEDEKIIDEEERMIYEFDNKKFDERSYLLDLLAENFEFDTFYNSSSDRILFLIQTGLHEDEESAYIDGNISCDGDYIIKDPTEIVQGIEKLRTTLTEIGLKPTFSKLFNICQIS